MTKTQLMKKNKSKKTTKTNNNKWKPPVNNRSKNKNGKTILRLRFN